MANSPFGRRASARERVCQRAVLLLAVGLAACLSVAHEKAHAQPRSDQTQAAAGAASGSAPAASELLIPPSSSHLTPPREAVTLEQAIDQALRREPRIEVALQEIARAEALVTQARAGWLPVLTANGTFTRLDEDRALPTGQVLVPKNNGNANVLLSVPLLSAQRWTASHRAKDNRATSRANAQEVRRQVVLATARAYLSVVAQQRVIEVNQRALDNAQAHYENAHARFVGGIGNELDDVRAGQEVAQSESQLESSRASLVSAQEALGVLLGREEPVDATAPEAMPSGIELPATELVQQRADVLAGKARVRAAERSVRDHWADFMPVLTGNLQAFYSNPATVNFPRTGWQAQLIVSLPLYDGGLRYGQQDERKALLAQSRTQLDGALRQAKSEVRVAFAQLVQADKSLTAATRGAHLARRALEMANLAYGAGATTDIEVVDAERRGRDAETAAVVAEDAARRARLELLIASGQLPK